MKLMKKVVKPASVPVFFVVASFLAIFGFASARAEEQSFWGGEQNPAVVVENANYQPPQNAGRLCFFQDFTINVKVSSFPTTTYGPITRNECATQTAFGTVSEGKILQFSSDPHGYVMNVPESQLPVDLPNAQSYVYTTHIGGTNRGLFAIDNPAAVFERQDRINDYEHMYGLKFGVTPRALRQSVSGNFVSVGSADASPDGSWLIANIGDGSTLARVHPETFAMLRFPGGYPKFSSNSTVQPDMAITGDGRYAAMSGGFNDSWTFKLYDLASCMADPADNMAVATGCEPKEMTSFLAAQIPEFHHAENLRFSADGGQLSMMAVTKDAAGVETRKSITLVAPGQEYAQLEYLAMGDSYASGEGDTVIGNRVEENGVSRLIKFYLPGTDVDGDQDTPREKCHISSHSYPFLLAQEWSIAEGEFANIACSGAKVEDIIDESNRYAGQFDQFAELQQEDRAVPKDTAVQSLTPGRAAQLQFIEKYKPKAVTISIAGNDAEFAGIISACVTNPLTCDYATDSAKKRRTAANIKKQFDALNDLLTKIHDKSEKTKIYVIGYPRLVHASATNCDTNVLLDSQERELVDEGYRYMNQVLQAATRNYGVKFIDTGDSLQIGALCSDFRPAYFTGAALQPPSETQESYHPNHLGHHFLKLAIEDNVAPDSVMTYSYCAEAGQVRCAQATDAPEVPQWFEPTPVAENARPYPFINNGEIFTSDALRAQVDYLQPGSQAHAEMRSDPVDLGTYTVDENGKLDATLTIPAGTPPGYHELHVYATAPSGAQIDFYQIILVKADENDIDGDGILNEADRCNFVTPANADRDIDGTDDACDPIIDEPPKPSITPPEYINAANKNSVTISGTGKADTTVHISANDTNPATAPVVAEAAMTETNGEYTYSKALDLSTLDDGAISLKAHLFNEFDEGPEETATLQKDTVLPVTAAAQAPASNANGWHNDSFTVALSATDSGTGIKQLTYSATGAQPIAEAIVNGDDASITITAQGITTITSRATDDAGNVEADKTLVTRLDTTSPTTTITQPLLSILIPLLGQKLTGTAADTFSGVAATSVTLTNLATSQTTVIQATCATGCAMPAVTTTWAASLSSLPLGIYNVTARSTDVAGNQGQPTVPVNIVLVGL